MVLPLLADYLLPRGSGQAGDHESLHHRAARRDRRASTAAAWCGCRSGRQAAIDALSAYRPGAGRHRRRRHGRRDDAAVPLRLRRHRLDAGGAVHDARAKGGRFPKSSAAIPRYSILKGEVPLVTQRIPALLTELQNATPTANATSPTACAWIGRTAGSTSASARPSRSCASSANRQGDAARRRCLRRLMDQVQELRLMPREHLLKIGVSGIRGVVGEFLTPLLAAPSPRLSEPMWARAAWWWARHALERAMLQHAVHCGLLAAGCEVVDVGVLPTPTIQIYTGATRARGGIAITASHNPPEYNALKLFNAAGTVLQPLRAQRTARHLSSERFPAGARTTRSAALVRLRRARRSMHIERVAEARQRGPHPGAQVPGGARLA